MVAFGGGSAIDSAKAFALALSPVARNRSLRDLLGTTANLAIDTSLPLYAVPTTAGTGSAITQSAGSTDSTVTNQYGSAGSSSGQTSGGGTSSGGGY